jgi:hypothetical protein
MFTVTDMVIVQNFEIMCDKFNIESLNTVLDHKNV